MTTPCKQCQGKKRIAKLTKPDRDVYTYTVVHGDFVLETCPLCKGTGELVVKDLGQERSITNE